ncbi:MAG TPA: hypothetical protein VFU16_03195 [Solirubrobacterales bacterium]|nr:hypothetical protein [Solirubrobacterales bacterium]
MANPLALIGVLLEVAEDELDGTAEELAKGIEVVGDDEVPPGYAADFEAAASCPDPEERAAMLGAWVICHQPFPRRNLEIGHGFMRRLLAEAEIPWPWPYDDPEVEAMLRRLEAGEIDVAKFADWARLRAATA